MKKQDVEAVRLRQPISGVKEGRKRRKERKRRGSALNKRIFQPHVMY